MSVSLLAMPSLDPTRGRVEITMPAGLSIAEMIETALPGLPAARHAMVRVTIGEAAISPAYFRHVKPRPGASVVMRIIPQSGNLRTVLMIVVAVAAIALGQFYLGPALAGMTAIGTAGQWAAISTAAISFGDSLMVDTLPGNGESAS